MDRRMKKRNIKWPANRLPSSTKLKVEIHCDATSSRFKYVAGKKKVPLISRSLSIPSFFFICFSRRVKRAVLARRIIEKPANVKGNEKGLRESENVNGKESGIEIVNGRGKESSANGRENENVPDRAVPAKRAEERRKTLWNRNRRLDLLFLSD